MKTCKYCDSTNITEQLRPDTMHYGEWRCLDCGRHLGWMKKPSEEKVKKREPEHQDLVKKYSEGYCVICMRLEEDLPSPQKLVAHHINEYKDGGESVRENIQIVCTYCHQTIHTIRTYVGHYVKTKDLSSLIAACEVELKRTGYTWRSARVLDFCERACGKRNRHFLREAHLRELHKRLLTLPMNEAQTHEQKQEELV